MGEVSSDVPTSGGGARLEVSGLTVEVVAVKWHGTTAVTVTYHDAEGRADTQLVYRDAEVGLSIDKRVGRGRLMPTGICFGSCRPSGTAELKNT